MIVKAKPKFVDFDAFLYEKVEEADELIRFVRGAIHEAHEVREDGTVVLRKGSPSELEVRLGDVVYYNDTRRVLARGLVVPYRARESPDTPGYISGVQGLTGRNVGSQGRYKAQASAGYH